MSENASAEKKPTTYSELYPGRFLHADHLKGKPVTLKIADVYREQLYGEKGKQVKAILAFEQTQLVYVCPPLNGRCLLEMFGTNVQEWIGKRVTLFPTAEFAPLKKNVPCIRVWGSPDLKEDVVVDIALPRRKAFKMTMRAGKASAQAPAPAPQPPEDWHDSPPPEDEDELGGRQ